MYGNRIIVLPFFLMLSVTVFSQDAKQLKQEKAAVRAVIDELFDGMRTGDSALVHTTLRNDARFATSYFNRENQPAFAEDNIQDFLIVVGTPHPEVWIEKITSCEIRIADNLAQVWATYEFYVDDTFSHCGVDAFQLVKEASGWKILNLTDTRRAEGCRK